MWKYDLNNKVEVGDGTTRYYTWQSLFYYFKTFVRIQKLQFTIIVIILYYSITPA